MSELNPYAPPAQAFSAEPDAVSPDVARHLRERYLGAETTMRALGVVHFVFAAVSFVAMISLAIGTWTYAELTSSILFGSLALGALLASLGYGLFRLRHWARWCQIGLCSTLALTAVVSIYRDFQSGMTTATGGVALVLVGLAIVRMLSHEKSRIVCSPEYAAVVRATPEMSIRGFVAIKAVLLIVAWSFCLVLFFAQRALP